MFFKSKKKDPVFLPREFFTDIMRIPLTERRYKNLLALAESSDSGETIITTILVLGYMGLIKTEPMEGDSDYNGRKYTEEE